MPNVPKPLHGLAPRTIKGQAWWDEVRQAAYRNANFKCEACGIPKEDAHYHKWLEAHEFYEYDYESCTATFLYLVALCHSCHNFIHSGRMKALLDKGEMAQYKYDHIINHGEEVLAKAGLIKVQPPTEVVDGAWKKWRLIFDGKEHRGQFETFDDWNNHYNG